MMRTFWEIAGSVARQSRDYFVEALRAERERVSEEIRRKYLGADKAMPFFACPDCEGDLAATGHRTDCKSASGIVE